MRKIFARVFLIIFLVVFDIFLLSKTEANSVSSLQVSFLDVGQGDSIFIESPTGVQMMIDTGAPGSALMELGKVMPFSDWSIDVLLLTHTDQDHNGSAPEVLERYNVGKLFISGDYSKEALDKEIIRIAEEKGVEIVEASRGQVIDLGAGAHATILFPDRPEESFESNTASVGLKLTYRESGFILTGDMPSEVEEYLVALDKNYLDAEVLKLGHHGSRTSTSENFLSVVSPEYVVVSAGENNRYGHPHPDVMDKLVGFQVIDMTKGDKVVTFKTDGKILILK